MKLFTVRTDAMHQAERSLDNYPDYLSHKDEPADIYESHQAEAGDPYKGYDNPQNLFDDVDYKDKYWLNIAKQYLRNFKH